MLFKGNWRSRMAGLPGMSLLVVSCLVLIAIVLIHHSIRAGTSSRGISHQRTSELLDTAWARTLFTLEEGYLSRRMR